MLLFQAQKDSVQNHQKFSEGAIRIKIDIHARDSQDDQGQKKNNKCEITELDVTSAINKTLSSLPKDFSFDSSRDKFVSNMIEFLKNNKTLKKMQKKVRNQKGGDFKLNEEDYTAIASNIFSTFKEFHANSISTGGFSALPMAEPGRGMDEKSNAKRNAASGLFAGIGKKAGALFGLDHHGDHPSDVMSSCLTAAVCAEVIRALNPGAFKNTSAANILAMPEKKLENETYVGINKDVGKLSRDVTLASLKLLGELAAKDPAFNKVQYDALTLAISNYFQSLDSVSSIKQNSEMTADWIDKAKKNKNDFYD
jgi:hypothetical protein